MKESEWLWGGEGLECIGAWRCHNLNAIIFVKKLQFLLRSSQSGIDVQRRRRGREKEKGKEELMWNEEEEEVEIE